MRSTRSLPVLATVVLATALLSACSDSGTDAATEVSFEPAAEAQTLTGVCPDVIGIQMDWEPEAEHGPLYNLVGPDYTVDTAGKSVTGTLVAEGKDTGVKVNVRAGGSAIGFQSVSSQMYVDDDLMLGTVTTDGAISASQNQPVTAVAALMKKSPQILMWDPETYPEWKTVGDIGKTGATVVVNQGNVFGPMLASKGLLKASQLDNSYDGAPARFVADPSIVQQGYATAEPYTYEHEVSAWGKPIASALVADEGYVVYPQAISVRADKLDQHSACLAKLVPIIQQSTLDYLEDPSRANGIITDIVTQYNDGWVYSEGVAEYGATQLKEQGFMGVEPGLAISEFDMGRIQATIDTFVPILEESGASPKADLTPDDLVTNQFIDTSIGADT